jgi:hypothetical protein
MANFAEIDLSNKVVRVLVVPDNEEHRGQEYLAQDLGLGGKWIQTSYNNKIRGKFAGVGDSYDEENDLFIAPEIVEEDLDPKIALLEKLGITEDEAKLLLGGN